MTVLPAPVKVNPAPTSTRAAATPSAITHSRGAPGRLAGVFLAWTEGWLKAPLATAPRSLASGPRARVSCSSRPAAGPVLLPGAQLVTGAQLGDRPYDGGGYGLSRQPQKSNQIGWSSYVSGGL
ncbi:hypothetical protein Raf01_86850 [Rugosimonospora africana]|uniref:Uncharacterized protein n=1 Tax=Rugosimonospora africana TaxID=556532 RepID=A0A8J3R2K9_9ACTN|nr:hypothetical protein Raf01_86850 [Rugosimonospora africana]